MPKMPCFRCFVCRLPCSPPLPNCWTSKESHTLFRSSGIGSGSFKQLCQKLSLAEKVRLVAFSLPCHKLFSFARVLKAHLSSVRSQPGLHVSLAGQTACAPKLAEFAQTTNSWPQRMCHGVQNWLGTFASRYRTDFGKLCAAAESRSSTDALEREGSQHQENPHKIS